MHNNKNKKKTHPYHTYTYTKGDALNLVILSLRVNK